MQDIRTPNTGIENPHAGRGKSSAGAFHVPKAGAVSARPRDAGLAWLLAAAFAALAVAWRLGPYMLDLGTDATWVWNFTPVGALGLFVGARLRSRFALLLPLAAMLVADLLLIRPLADRGFASFSRWTPVIYASVLAYALIVRLGPAGRLWVVGASLAGSVQFFLVTNFLCWAGGDGMTYPRTAEGLLTCYGAGLPFFRYTVAGDLLFAGLFFGLNALALLALRPHKASQPA
jgi:hypothetical protein